MQVTIKGKAIGRTQTVGVGIQLLASINVLLERGLVDLLSFPQLWLGNVSDDL